MHIAAKRADVRMLQTLVLLGADWQVADSDGATALHYAANHSDNVKALVMFDDAKLECLKFRCIQTHILFY